MSMPDQNIISASDAARALVGRRNEVLTKQERLDIAVAGGKARRRQLMKMSQQERSALARRAARARWR